MEKYDFHMRLIAASYWARRFAQRLVIDRLPFEFGYSLCAQKSGCKDICHCISSEEVVETIWRGGKVPRWIDIAVERVDGKTTIFQLICSDEYEAVENKLYYTWGGSAPFGIKSPDFPCHWFAPSQHGLIPHIKFRLSPTFWTHITDFLLLRWIFCRIDSEMIEMFKRYANKEIARGRDES